MYIYFCVFLLVFITALRSLKKNVDNNWINFLLFILGILSVFRFGQGTDYLEYALIMVSNSSVNEVLFSETHGEIGFRLLSAVFEGNFVVYFAIITLFNMAMLYRFLDKYCKNQAFSLLLFIHTFYFGYYLSTIRQGIIIAAFIGIGISLIERKHWKEYILLCLVLSTIHTVALVLLSLVLIDKLNFNFLTKILLPVAILFGLWIGLIADTGLLASIPFFGSYVNTYLTVNFSITAILERIVTLSIVMLFYSYSYYNYSHKPPWWIKAYLWGHILFFAFMPFSTLAIRVFICFKVLEVMFIPNMLIDNHKFNIFITLYFIFLPVVMYFHNINSFIDLGNYYENINAFNYPYVSIFNPEDIWNYRDYKVNSEMIMEWF